MGSKIVIHGGNTLNGQVGAQGSKNAVLPIISAAILIEGPSTIHNCPDISDVSNTMQILEYLGCKVTLENGTLLLDAAQNGRLLYPGPADAADAFVRIVFRRAAEPERICGAVHAGRL